MGCTQSQKPGPPAGTLEAYFDPTANPAGEEVYYGYTVQEEIAESYHGRLLKASKGGEEDICLKVVEKRYLLYPTDALVEVEMLRAAEHEHVVRLVDFGETEERYFIVTEFMEGGELFERIASLRHYTEEDARDVVELLLRTIAHLHARNIVHRDIKPESLQLARPFDNRSLKLADFGSAQRLDSIMATRLRGSPSYVAPEMLRREPYSVEVDMWSLGVIVFIMLGGYMPFYDQSARNLKAKVLAADYTFDSKYWSHVSEEAKDFVAHLLLTDPKRRMTAEEALLHPWIGQETSILHDRNLDKSIAVIKLFNARRKFRAAVHVATATGRLRDFIRKEKARIETEEPEEEIAGPAVGSAANSAGEG